MRLYNIARQMVKPNHQQFNGFHRVASPVGNGHGDSCCHAVSLLSSLIFVELLRKRRYILNISDIRPCLFSTNPHPGDIAVETRQGRFFFSLSQPPHQHSQKAEQHPMLGICSAFLCYDCCPSHPDSRRTVALHEHPLNVRLTVEQLAASRM